MTWLPGATIRVSAILLVAFVLAWLLSKRAASLRHAVLAIALGCAAIVPLLSAFMPPWTALSISLPPPIQQLDSAPTANAATARAQADSALLAEPTPDDMRPRPVPAWNTLALPLLQGVYLAGLAVSLLALLPGLLRLRWIVASSQPVHAKQWLDELAAIRSSYDIRRPVQLSQSAHPAVLATCGFLRPHVLLPAGAERWQVDRIRTVLLHELAHIRRNDWLIQLLACLLRAFYWFNPLLWMACARLRAESEQACDDAAIEQGIGGAEYATQLLALARAFAQPVSLPAVSMARGIPLRRRIAGILDTGIPRAPATCVSIVRTAAVMLTVTWVIAACQMAQMPAHLADIRPHAVAATNPARPQSGLPAAVPPIQSSGQNAAPGTALPPRPIDTLGGRGEDSAPDPLITADVGASPRLIAVEIADFARSTLSTGVLARPLGNDFLVGTVDMLERVAQRLLSDDGDAVSVAAKGTALLAALGDAINSAASMASQRSLAWETRQELRQLEGRLREKSATLAAAILPLPAVTSIVVSTPERRAAVEALDLAQTARAEPLLGGPRPHRSLLAGLDTLERAAQSVVLGDDSDRMAASARLIALSTALLMTARVAANIGERPVEPTDGRRKAADLAASLRSVATRLGVVAPPPDDTQWLGWALPRKITLTNGPAGGKP